MSEKLRISVRFLDGSFHGRGDGGESEWPPSPLRLFQALTNAAARLGGDGIGVKSAAALRWLEALKEPPEIFASIAEPTTGYQLYVPDNVGDLPKAINEGVAAFRTEKLVCPHRLLGEAAVHYRWTLDATSDIAAHRETLIAMTRAVSRLGWGVDLVVADAAVETDVDTAAPLAGEHWLPVESFGGSLLRVPVPGTLSALEDRHTAFMNRIRQLDDGGLVFAPVQPLNVFRVVTYRRENEIALPPFAIFALREPDDSKFAAFGPQWRRLHLVGMLRHTASQPDFAAALGWDEARICAFVLGHDKRDPHKTKPTIDTPRLVFTPLPSIEWRGEDNGRTIGAIRRVLVTVAGGTERFDTTEFHRIVRALEGRELVDEKSKHTVAFIRRQSTNERAISSYFETSSAWTTVTPVVLPGYDDPRKLRRRLRDTAQPLSSGEKEQIIRKLDVRVERLLRKALLEAGIPASLVADADLQWRGTGFIPGVDLASRYSVPDQCRRFRRLHVRVVWRERIPDGSLQPVRLSGPFCVGSGRLSGLGLFVPVS